MNSHQELDKEIQKDIENFLNKKPTTYITEVYFQTKNNDLYNDFYYCNKEKNFHSIYKFEKVTKDWLASEKINLFTKYDNIYDLINEEKNNIEDIIITITLSNKDIKFPTNEIWPNLKYISEISINNAKETIELEVNIPFKNITIFK